MPRYTSPGFCSSLKEARYWSMDWIAENSIHGPFQYVVLLKKEGGYSVLGQYATASEAFEDRRRLVEETGIRSYFLRAIRVSPIEDWEVVGPGHPESGEDIDRWRDALRTGDESLISQSELSDFRRWAASTVESRSAYRRSSARSHCDVPF